MNKQRLQELILYISQQMEEHRHAGSGRIKLAKLVWRIDFASYWFLGKPITDSTYIVDTLGPKFSNEREFIDQMITEGIFRWSAGFDRQKIPTALREPDMSEFSDTEMSIIDTEIQSNRALTAKEMVDQAHHFPGYKHAAARGSGTEIPYASVYWANRTDPEPWEIAHAAELTISS
jgi:hypothetical protein